MQFIKHSITYGPNTKPRFFWSKYIAFFTLVAFLFSCEDFVDLDIPDNQIDGQTVFNEPALAEAALLDIYATMRNEQNLFSSDLFDMSVFLGHYSDELTLKLDDLSFRFREFSSNGILPNNEVVVSIWRSAYRVIYRCNIAYLGLDAMSPIEDSIKDQFKGEALFARAFMHFYLVNLFGDVPYVTTSDHLVNDIIGKTPEAEVYDNIVNDLLEAKDLIGETYVGSDRTRPNKATVSALLARVYLYMEDWANAEIESTLVIDNTGLYTFEEDITKVFLKDSPSTIWQLGANQVGGNTLFASTYNLGISTFVFSETQLAAFSPSDTRQFLWTVPTLDQLTFELNTAPFKYQAQNLPSGTTTELNKVFRLGEQYLIRAEARAQLNKIAEARSDLSMTQTRAGLFEPLPNDKNSLLTAILQERRLELFAEFSHRWFDLKRTGTANAFLSTIPEKTEWEATDVLFPIPEDELLTNENLKPQNPGY